MKNSFTSKTKSTKKSTKKEETTFNLANWQLVLILALIVVCYFAF